MRRALSILVLISTISAGAQVANILIPAGSPEDKALQEITAENDTQKRVTMLQDFLQKFASNQQAVIYGQWQLAQQYMELGDTAKAMEYGQKAMAGQPNNLDILVFVAGVAQKAKTNDVVMDCASRGAAAFNGIANQPKPEGIDPENFALRIKQAQDPLRPSYEYLEATAYNTMLDEKDRAKRMGYIERFLSSFPNSRFQEQAMQLALSTLADMKDSTRLASFSEKALAANPNSVSMLVVLSAAFAEGSDAASITRAEGYARKALSLTKGQTPNETNQLQLYTGLGHSALGYALLKEEKSSVAIEELKTACGQLKDVKDHPDAYSEALYRLGFAYAKTPGRLPDAKAALTELAAIQGPYQQPARDLLARVQAASAKAPARTK